MDPLDLAIMQLDSLIAGLEIGSSIPIAPAELKLIKQLIETAQRGETLKLRKD